MPVALLRPSLRHVADSKDRQLLDLDRNRSIEHVDRDHLPLSGACPMEKRGQHALDGAVSGDRVDRISTRRRRRIRRPPDVETLLPLIA